MCRQATLQALEALRGERTLGLTVTYQTLPLLRSQGVPAITLCLGALPPRNDSEGKCSVTESLRSVGGCGHRGLHRAEARPRAQ